MKIINQDKEKECCDIQTIVHLDEHDFARIHDAVLEATDKTLTFEECIVFLENNPDIMQSIVSIGECETQVGDECYTKAQYNLLKFGNVFGIDPKV